MHSPDREEWNTLDREQQETFARDLTRRLPESIEFSEVREFRLAGKSQRVAMFSERSGSTFVFVPGGEVTLGFDAATWRPNHDERESWQDTAEEYEIETSLNDHIDSSTTNRRRVKMTPLLVETIAAEVGWEPADFDEPDVKALIKDLGRRKGTASMSRGDRETRVTRDGNGQLTAEVANQPTHESLSAALQEKGFRFPTSDEWEYLCGAGAETLFRWGDHAPCDRYPTDISPEEAAWRREWVLAGGKLEYPGGAFKSDWNYHRQPNLFGLIIAENPYHFELVAEHNTTRGGDGGSTICGGAGFFVGWLTLATAYFEDHACIIDPEYGMSVGYTIGRRVLPLK